MPPFKKNDKDTKFDERNGTLCSDVKMRLFSLFIMVAGPLFLVYVNIRCEKNQCVLLQFPLVLPTHFTAYFSRFSCVMVALFLLFTFSVNNFLNVQPKKGRPPRADQPIAPPSTLGYLITISILMVCTAYLKPEYIKFLRSEHLRLLCTTTAFSVIFAFVLSLLVKLRFLRKERDHCFPMGFFYGFNTKVWLGKVNLKYYFYVNVGLVGWGLLDLLIFVNFVLERPVTAPLCFVFITQFVVILHTLLYEKFLVERPFMFTEGLGFFWLMRVLLFMPFLFSLPLLYTSTTEITIPKPAMLANCGLFMFGFVIYISSLHQKENYANSPSTSRPLKSILTSTGRRLLVNGYWGTVQKPDYLGYMIMWFSWVVACGFSAVSVVVLLIVYSTISFWLIQTTSFHKERYGSAWNRYTSLVPHRIIPLIY